jgi:hypothetical protein
MTNTQDILTSTSNLLKRVEEEGVTQGSQTLLQPGQYSASTGQIKLPTQKQITPDVSSAKGRTSYYQQLIESREAEAEQARQAQVEAQKAQVEKASAIDKIKEQFGLVGQKRKEELTNLGFEPTQQFADQKADIAETEKLYEDYDKSVAARDAQLAAIESRPGISMSYLGGEQARINREANVVLGQKASAIKTKLAIMEMKNNNFTQAQNFVDQAIKDYTAGLTADYETAIKFYDDNQDIIDNLGKDYTSALKEKQALILDQITAAEQEARYKIEDNFKQQGLNIDLMNAKRLLNESIPTPTSATDWTDLQFRTTIQKLKDESNASYEEVVQEINSDPTIKNKERGLKIARKLYGIPEPSKPLSEALGYSYTPFSPIYANKKQPPLVTSSTPGKYLGEGESFYVNLFGQ